MKAWIAVSMGLGMAACSFDKPEPIPKARLTVELPGTGPGRVTGGGIDCAAGNIGTCTVEVTAGEVITLTQMPGSVATGSQNVVDGWGEACASAGTAPTCTVTLDDDRRVTLGYRLQHQVSVTLVASEGGQGTVSSTPAGLSCATGTCNAFFDADADVTLTATPATPNDRVSATTGDCSTMPCTLASLAGPRATTVTILRSACLPSTSTCTLGALTQCDAEGNYVSYLVPNGAPDGTATTITMNGYLCPLGCHASGTRCNDVDATNGLNAALDSPAVSPAGIDLVLPRVGNNTPGTVTIASLAAGASELVITDTDGFELRAPAMRLDQGAGLPQITVVLLRTLTLRAGTTLRFRDGGWLDAVAFATHFDTMIAGTIDLKVGPGRLQSGCVGAVSSAPYTCTGGGASRVGSGGACNAPGGLGGQTSNVPRGPLVGGCDPLESTGGGGGAVMFVSRTRVVALPGALVDASGSNPQACLFTLGGGGGGTVVLEAPQLALSSGSVIAGRGASGDAHLSDTICAAGVNGTVTGTAPARGATCAGCGVGGDGGTEMSPMGGAGTGTLPALGGGGGAVGYCETRTGSNTYLPPTGTMKIWHSHVRLGVR